MDKPTKRKLKKSEVLGKSGWLTITINPTPVFVQRYLGDKCKEFADDCIACRGWRQFEQTGTIDVLVDNEQMCRALLGLRASI